MIHYFLKILLLLMSFSLFFLTSCDNRDKFFNKLNEKPVLTIQKNGVEYIQDSIKTSLKSGAISTDFVANIQDNNAKEISVNYTLGNGKIKIDNIEATKADASTKNKFTITVQPMYLGVNEVEIVVKDEFGETANKRLQLTAFKNINPIARLFIFQDKGYEYEINAIGSTDSDAKYGGFVSLFKYTVDGQPITINENAIKYNFGNPGFYKVSLQVYDNDGGESTEVSQLLEVK